jgi:hypothetical protein
MCHNQEFELLSKLPTEIILTIITKYTGHYRIEKNDNKIKLIPRISSERKQTVEKLFRNDIKIIGRAETTADTTYPYIIYDMIIPLMTLGYLKDIIYQNGELIGKFNEDENEDENEDNYISNLINGRGKLKKYIIIRKTLSTYREHKVVVYCSELVETQQGYFSMAGSIGDSKRYVQVYSYF